MSPRVSSFWSMQSRETAAEDVVGGWIPATAQCAFAVGCDLL